MKSIIILYNQNNKYQKQPLIANKNSLDLTLESVGRIVSKVNSDDSNKELKFVNDLPIIIQEKNTIQQLIEEIISETEKAEADTICFSFADCPFLNDELCIKLLNHHFKYNAEYTYADGYLYGFSSEIIDLGALKILNELLKSKYLSDYQKNISRGFLFEMIKKDINSFEVETVIAPNDWRLLRQEFHCEKKENYYACKALFSKTADNYLKMSAEQLCDLAKNEISILKTVPSFYNIQIAQSCTGKCTYCPYPKAFEEKYNLKVCDSTKVMPFSDFEIIIEKIADFSEQAVIGLSAWGESLNNPEILNFIKKVLSYEGLSVFLETDGLKIDEDFCKKLKEIVDNSAMRSNGWPKIMIVVSLDSFSSKEYGELRGNESLYEQAVSSVKMLSEILPECVYPQFVRQKNNEDELENFYRYWNEKSNPSQGQLIIQKYNDFCQTLPDLKPADLSPLERNVCWHLRRDMTILINGDVPLCYNHLFDNIKGNAITDPLQDIWKNFDEETINHINKKYCDKCGKCDEYYTFNF